MSAENDNKNAESHQDSRHNRFPADAAALSPKQKSVGRKIVMFCIAAAVIAGMARPVYREVTLRVQGQSASAADMQTNETAANFALNDAGQWLRGGFALKLQRALELSFNFVEGNAPSFTDARIHFTDSGWDDFSRIERGARLVSGDKPKVSQHISIIKGPAHFQVLQNGMPVVEPHSYRVIFEGITTSGDYKLTYTCRAALIRPDDNAPLEKVAINGMACSIAGLPK